MAETITRRQLVAGLAVSAVCGAPLCKGLKEERLKALDLAAEFFDQVPIVRIDYAGPGTDYTALIEFAHNEIIRITAIPPEMLYGSDR